MPSIRDLRPRLLTPENVGITVAIVLSVVGAYAIQLRVSTSVAACTATFVIYVGSLIVVSGRDGSLLDAAVAFTLTALAVEAAARMLD